MSSKPTEEELKFWDEQLEKSGFIDIEKDERQLKEWHSHYFERRYTPENFIIKQDYYQMCNIFLNEYGFDSRLDLEIWRLHSQGLVPKSILKRLTLKTSQAAIYNIIRRLENIMKLGLHYED